MDSTIINKYFPQLTEVQKEQFIQLAELYREWNAKINIISRKDIDFVEERHILHGLAIAKVLAFAPKTSVLDVGTGGGIPGIPLAIMFPEVNFHLIDAIGKKIGVVQEIATALGLKNVIVEQRRAESLKTKYDFVIGRGVTDLSVFASWVRGKFSSKQLNSLPNGILYLKGGDLQADKQSFKSIFDAFPIADYFEEPFFETKFVVYLSIG